MKHRVIGSIGLTLLFLLGLAGAGQAAEKVRTVASFSILGDMVRQVGGDRVDIVTLVGPDSDAHVFSPTPADAKDLAGAKIFFVNGLGFESWADRFVTSSGFKGDVVVASKGIKPRTLEHGEDHHHGEAAHGEADHGKTDHGDEDHGAKEYAEHVKAGHEDDEEDEDEEEETDDPHAW